MKRIVLIIAGLLAVGCSVEKAAIPPVSAPSEFGLSISATAVPDQLPRDGSAQSVVTVTARDASGRPMVGLRLNVSPTIGSVSQSEVVTGSDGRASFAFIAPESTTPGNSATIFITPVSTNAENAVSRTVSILLSGVPNRAAPTPNFSFAPAAPVMGETVSFDASTTTDEGSRCNDVCTYEWDFGGDGTASGRLATHRFSSAGSFAVKLTVTDAAGSSAFLVKDVAVTAGTAPTATFTFSPTAPVISEAVQFTGEASRVGQAGRTITNHQWQFGDGTNASGLRVSHAYSAAGTYPVTLTVTDSAGAQGTSSQNVAVVAGITASFTISPTDPTISQTVILNAEGSTAGRGSTIKTYIWNYGNSTSTVEETDPITETSYSAVGTYTINLTVVDSAGRRATTSKTVTVE